MQKVMEQIGWTSIVLSVLTLLGGCGWLIDRKKHRQEIESLKADNRQKDMNRRTSERRGQAGLGYPEREGGNAKRNLSRDYVTEWRTYIAEPLTIVDLCRDSAMSESELSPLRSLLHRLQREVGELRQEVAELRHAIQAIDICPHRDGCPVLDELRKQSQGD